MSTTEVDQTLPKLLESARAAMSTPENLIKIVRANSSNAEFQKAILDDDALYAAVEALTKKEAVEEDSTMKVPLKTKSGTLKTKTSLTTSGEGDDRVFTFGTTEKKADVIARGIALDLPTKGTLADYKSSITKLTEVAFYNEANCWKVVSPSTNPHWAMVSIRSTSKPHYALVKSIHESMGHTVPPHSSTPKIAV